MRTRARIVLLGLAAALASLLSVTFLVLLPLSRDETGDVRKLVAVRDDGQLTFAGVGVGSPSDGSPSDDSGVPELGFRLRTYTSFPGDFGTTFFVFGDVEDERVTTMTLVYGGNPLALGRLVIRWREVFLRAAGECRRGTCYEPASDARGDATPIRAELSTDYAWYGPKTVSVRFQQAR
jgi:hypothetical protein